MAQNSTFQQILNAKLGITNSGSRTEVVKEEEQALWVQVLPFLPQEKWQFQKASPYKAKSKKSSNAFLDMVLPLEKNTHTQSQTTVQTEIPKVTPAPASAAEVKAVETSFMSVADLNAGAMAQLELLIRGSWVKRADRYGLSEWKKAHRKAVKALHPDFNDKSKNAEFSEVHENFKSLQSHFKAAV